MSDLKSQIKQLIVESLMLEDTQPNEISDDALLFGEGLGLDSVDALELAVEIERTFGVKIPDDTESRAIFTSVNTLSAFLQPLLAR